MFIVQMIMGLIVAGVAVLRGRSPLWFFAGYFFNIFGLILILILPSRSAISFRWTNQPQPPKSPEERSEDYVPPVIQKQDYKQNSIDIGHEVVEDKDVFQ